METLGEWARGARRGTEPSGGTLIVQVSGEPAVAHDLTGETIRIGRAAENDVTIGAPFVSRQLATLRRAGNGYTLQPTPGGSILYARGRPVRAEVPLEHGDQFRIIGPNAGEMVTLAYTAADAGSAPSEGVIPLQGLTTLRIGSAADADLGAGNESLDPLHATIHNTDGTLHLRIEGRGISQVNGALVSETIELHAGDVLRLGGLQIRVHDDRLEYRDVAGQWLIGRRRARAVPEELLSRLGGEGGVQLDARHLHKHVRHGIDLLQDISLRIRPRELVVLVGLSGAGKTSLLNALAGYSQATDGQVLVDDVDLYHHFDRFRPSIEFVPQRDIIHRDLTVYEALDYAARLRLPPGTSEETRRERIERVLDDLDLTARRDVRVRQLSGGQQKRVSIGVELITSPQLFFLDEPTSGLDPGTETGLMQLLRRLADGGRTVVLITHATKNVMLADRVLFMVRGGHLAWYGPPKEALAYFQRQRPEAERENGELEFDAIYALLDDPERGAPEEWDDRYRGDPSYARYIESPLRLAGDEQAAVDSADPPAEVPQISAWQQFLILSSRNLRLLTRDRIALALMLLAAPLLASLDFLVTSRHMYDPTLGDPLRATIGGTTLAINGVFVGALSQAREVIKDADIYRRERLVNLKIAPYILSKVWVAVLLAVYQAAAWVGVRYLAVQMPGGLHTAIGIYITVLLTVIAGMMLGLLASTVAPTEEAVTMIVALFIVPQILFNGSFMPLPELGAAGRAVTTVMASRWSFETVMTQSMMGHDLGTDPGWHLSRAQRASLTPAQTQADRCLGIHIFTECTFPGIRANAQPAVYQPAPKAPAPPAATASPAARATYRTALTHYRTAYAAWTRARATSIAGAEAVLEDQYDKYGAVYNVDVPEHWGILIGISVILVLAMLGIQRAKDRQ